MFSYGFCLKNNKFDTLRVRVVVGTAPQGKIEDPNDLLPSETILADQEHLGTTTELLQVKPFKLSPDLLNYLRSVLMNNFEGDEDHIFILVSTPRVLAYELLVVEFAIKLLDTYAKKTLLKRSSLAKDLSQKYDSYEKQTISQYNIEQKQIYHHHLKMLKVLRAILSKISYSLSDSEWTKLTFERTDFEVDDSDADVFRRRMGMRTYFKELRMNTRKLQESKSAATTSQQGKPAKKGKKTKK
jgi:hypothetical protein